MATLNRFAQRPGGPNRAAAIAPQPHTLHTTSMLAQASRVPRLSNLGISGARAGKTSGNKK